MTERILQNYLTGLKTSVTDDAGEHAEAVAVASVLVIDALGQTPAQRQITIQAQIFHSEEVFNRSGKPLQVGNGKTIQKQFVGDDYLTELDNAPLTMLVLARHLQKKMREMELGQDADGNPITLENAVAVPLPDYLNTPELQGFLAQFDAIENQMAQAITAMNQNGQGENE